MEVAREKQKTETIGIAQIQRSGKARQKKKTRTCRRVFQTGRKESIDKRQAARTRSEREDGVSGATMK